MNPSDKYRGREVRRELGFATLTRQYELIQVSATQQVDSFVLYKYYTQAGSAHRDSSLSHVRIAESRYGCGLDLGIR